MPQLVKPPSPITEYYGRIPRTLNEAFGPHSYLHIVETSPRVSRTTVVLSVLAIAVLAVAVGLWVQT